MGGRGGSPWVYLDRAEYSEPGKPAEYRYTASEHAAVELALRDARKRYAIDSDRVFAAGQLTGGSMAWDYALAHPDEFAGVVVISGLPAKYVPRYLPHHERLPLFYVLGEYVPAARGLSTKNMSSRWIVKAWDVTYVEYFRRGLEELPEEIIPAYDWMDRHRRDPYPKSFKAYTARTWICGSMVSSSAISAPAEPPPRRPPTCSGKTSIPRSSR